MNVYVVFGTCGEYSDRQEWAVAAYLDRVLADKHADAAMLRANEYKRTLKDRYSYNSNDLRVILGALDPQAKADYGGTDYYVIECPLLEAVPG